MAETIPCDTSKLATATVSSTTVLEAAHQTLRDIREEQIHDLDTALKKLGDERRKYVGVTQIFFVKNQIDILRFAGYRVGVCIINFHKFFNGKIQNIIIT